MSYKGLMLFALLFVCVVRAERFALLTDLLARYDPYSGKIRAPVHLNYSIDSDIKFKGIVIPKHCNIYEGPAVSHKVAGVLSQFDKVKVVGEVVFTESGEEARHSWYKLGDKRFVMEHYIFNPNKFKAEGSESSEYYSDVKTDFNHVEGEKPEIEEVKPTNEAEDVEADDGTEGTAVKESMADMAAQDNTDSVVNGVTDDEAANTGSTGATAEATEGGVADAVEATSEAAENTNPTAEVETTENTDATAEATEGETTENTDATAEATEGETTENTDATAEATESETTENTDTTTEGETTENTKEAADVTGAGDIYDEEADG